MLRFLSRRAGLYRKSGCPITGNWAVETEYAGEIEIYAGLEIDYLNEIQNPANSYLLQALPLDYRIGSVHLVYTDEEEIIDTDTDPENFGIY